MIKRATWYIDEDMLYRMKRLALDNRTTLTKIANQAFADYLDKYYDVDGRDSPKSKPAPMSSDKVKAKWKRADGKVRAASRTLHETVNYSPKKGE